jgi:glycosyltransferase involved in cell wall biosynthesis
MKNKISVIIPVRNRDIERLKRCIKSIKDNSYDMIDKIVVVDYNSTIPIKLDNVSVIRVNDVKFWNKGHALNIGILNTNTPFIMTIDGDMLISKNHFNTIREHITKECLIISTNVRRVLMKDYGNYDNMIKTSTPWQLDNRDQLINQVNGGFQVYPREFYNSIGGLSESIGLWWGGIDNWMYFISRMNGLDIIDISYPLLHQEHPERKEENMIHGQNIKDLAEKYRLWKATWLDKMVKENINHNPDKFYGKKKPCISLFNTFIWELNGMEEIKC